MVFRNKKFVRKIQYGYIAIGAVATIIIATNLWYLSRTTETIDREIFRDYIGPKSQIEKIHADLLSVQNTMMRLSGRNFAASFRSDAVEYQNARTSIDKSLDSLQSLSTDPQIKKGLAEVIGKWKNYKSFVADPILSASITKNYQMAADIASEDGMKLGREMMATFDSVDVILTNRVTSIQASMKSTISRIMWLSLFGMSIGAVIFGIWTFLLAPRIASPIKSLQKVLRQLSEGDYSASVTVASTDEFGELERAFSVLTENVKAQVAALIRIASGELTVDIPRSSDHDMLAAGLTDVVSALRGLVDETGRLTRAAIEGRLGERGNSDQFQGGYREIVNGINDTLDAVITPLKVAATYVDRISKGDIPPRLTSEARGEFNDIQNNLNQCIDAVNLLIADVTLLSSAGVEGRLSVRADATRHEGDFRKIIEGMNGTLDAVIGPLTVAAWYVDRMSRGDVPPVISDEYAGDFNDLKNNLNRCIQAINLLIADTGQLSQAAVEGNLSDRVDASRHQGDFKRIVEGVNATLDAVIGPLNAAAHVVDRIADGDIPEAIVEEYKGDFNALKGNLNTCIDAVNKLVVDAKMLSDAAVEGKLSVRASAERHKGDFRKIVEGFNGTLDAVIRPVSDGARVLEAMGKGDLATRVDGVYVGDHQLIKDSINRVGESLSRALGEVSEAVNATASASSQISSSTEEMAAGAQEQASQTSEVAGAMEQMTRTILANSKNASTTAETARRAKESAQQGGEVVEQTVAGMRRIAEVVHRSAKTVKELGRSSDQIGEIISVIDDIADQTNLLALNAAIEAARAGDQGRGFAVVADEVRKLAERTTKATKEIAGMIKKIQTDTAGAVESMDRGTAEVEGGIQLADKAGQSLQEIVRVSQKVMEMVQQIAEASEEQSSSAEQISRNIEAISAVTQQTGAGTQQIARAAEDLNRLTDNLAGLIRQFRFLQDGGKTAARGLRAEEKGTTAATKNGILVRHDGTGRG
jgi:methyl-accepting chemotaxis protein